MSATERLRALLDERGVEYEGGERSLRWRDHNGVMMQAFPLANGELGMGVWSCTPEQAIAATLGPCTDSSNCTNGERTGERTDIAATLEVTDARQAQAESSGTCRATETDHYRVRTEGTGCPLTVRIMECSKCGGTYGYVTGGYEYCPRCGRKVVDPMTNDVDMEVDDG